MTGGALTLFGLIAVLVVLIAEYPNKSVYLAEILLPSGLLVLGAAVALQFWATVAKDKNKSGLPRRRRAVRPPGGAYN
ncbi:MAG: hypothetical protein LBD90_07515 [Bifidobacteriaceae bacterium]|nr:hypothetical protein [Bifidobacteriaceae bacterium]